MGKNNKVKNRRRNPKNIQMEALHKLAEIFIVATGASQAKIRSKNNESTTQGSVIPMVEIVHVTHKHSLRMNIPQETTIMESPRVMVPEIEQLQNSTTRIDKNHAIPEETDVPHIIREHI